MNMWVCRGDVVVPNSFSISMGRFSPTPPLTAADEDNTSMMNRIIIDGIYDWLLLIWENGCAWRSVKWCWATVGTKVWKPTTTNKNWLMVTWWWLMSKRRKLWLKLQSGYSRKRPREGDRTLHCRQLRWFTKFGGSLLWFFCRWNHVGFN